MKMDRDIWLILWSICIAFLFQVLYESLGILFPNGKIFLGIIIACGLLLGLLFVRPIAKDEKQQNNENESRAR